MAEQYKHIVILTGAGISAESGLDTFRDQGGIWSRYALEDVATPEAFRRNPDLVHEFYNMRRSAAAAVAPNAAHHALARLEAEFPGTVWVVTQNVDCLHERAGTRNLIHMHGELAKLRCSACGDIRPAAVAASVTTRCDECFTVGAMRPHIVWFGEMPLAMARIEHLLVTCDLFISVGTSGTVYPAAGFVETVRRHGRAHTVELNLEPSLGESLFGEKHYGQASELVPRYVDNLLGDRG